MEAKREVLAFALEWREKLCKCQYAGELYLDRECLVRLTRAFARFMEPGDELYETALLVLAVNCAYHYYDDQGFWLHFCDLLGIENTSANQQRIGQAVERRLDLLGLKKTERTGPFRYVGAILEQCGVSKRYIAALANIVKELKRGFRSRDALIMLGHREFQNRLDMFNCSRYLKDFLKDASGWKFTLQVCEVLMLYEQGSLNLEDLKELPGYQPGFWDEFIVHLGQRRQPVRTSFVLRPRLLFIPEERCLAIRFPGFDYVGGVRHPIMPGFWQFPLTLLKRTEAWSDYYAGSKLDSEGRTAEWVLPGWLPDGLPALFDLKYGFIRRGSTVRPGEYHLLIPEDYRTPCRVVSELGPVQVPGYINYRACRVLVESGTRIYGYESARDNRADIALTWVEPERFRLWCADPSVDVFSGSLPALAVSDFTLIKEQGFAMFYTAGSLYGRIRNQHDLERSIEEINKNAPVAGRFFILAIGRTGRPEIASALVEVEFYLLPPLDIKFSRRPYAFDEEPEIEINPEFPGRLHLEGCRRTDPCGKTWVVPVAISRIVGVIECQKVMAGIDIPVHRARLYFPDRKPARYLIKTELKKNTTLLLTGYPDSEARLQLHRTPASNVPIKFDADGLARVSSEQLLKLVEDCGHSIAEVIQITGEHTVSTGAVIIDFHSVSTGICTGTGYRACVRKARNLTALLDVCTQICKGVLPGRRYNLSRIPRFNRLLDEWIFSIFACAAAFEEVDVLVGGRKYNWVEEIGDEKLRYILDFISLSRMSRWTGEFPPSRNDVIPPVERWQNMLAQFLLPYIADEGTPGLSEWADEVRHHRTRFRSGIALMKGGYSLSSAWVCYHRGLFESALSLLNNMGEGPPVLTELRNFLYVLLLLRLARMEAARQAIESRQPGGNFQPAFSLLEYVVRTLNAEETGPSRQFRTEIINQLPLRAEDRVFFEMASKNRSNPADKDAVPNDGQYWLLLWFIILSCSDPQLKSELAEQLLRSGDKIPPSPEKTKIIERLNKFSEVKDRSGRDFQSTGNAGKQM